MQNRRMIRLFHTALLAMILIATASTLANAQVHEVGELGRTDVALSLYGSFSGTTTGNGVQQSPANSAGGLVEIRHIANPLVGFEGTYSFNRDNQTYTPLINCGLPCGNITSNTIKADAHEVTADYLASLKVLNLRPFALAGGGLLFNQPTSPPAARRTPAPQPKAFWSTAPASTGACSRTSACACNIAAIFIALPTSPPSMDRVMHSCTPRNPCSASICGSRF